MGKTGFAVLPIPINYLFNPLTQANMDQNQEQPDYIDVALSDETFDDHSGLSAGETTAETAPSDDESGSFLMSLEEAGGQPIEADAILVFDSSGGETN
jgi:hypothetical protein